MMTLSKALTATQAQKYYEEEYSNARESYYTEDETIEGEWFGKLAEEWGLEGAVDKEAFARLTEGQNPHTGEQLVRHVTTKEYENQFGEKVKNSEHRAGYDATFSAPKSVSLAALVGDDERIRDAHRTAVKTAMGELENYVQARMGGKTPAQTTRNFAAALFEHDSARPDKETGYAAPQLHTHSVIFNLTRLNDDRIKPIQPVELYRTQQYATAVYRSVLSEQLQKLGYEVEVDPRTGAPEIKGFSNAYLIASSPRRKQIEKEADQIKERLNQQGITVQEGAGLNQAAAKLNRKSKRYDRTEMRARHQEMDTRFENEAARAVGLARERGAVSLDEEETKKRAQSAVTFARQNAGAREAVVDKRKVMVDALRRNMSFTTHDAVVKDLSQRLQTGEFIAIQRFDKFEELTTSQMLALERSNIHQMLAGRDTQEPILKRKEASKLIKEIFEDKGKRSSFDQYKAVGRILVTRDRVFALEGLAGTGKTTALSILREAAERQGFAVRGLAPTGRAADKLAESGINTTTLQGFLKESSFGAAVDNNRRLYILDESSLSDTRNLHLFLKKAGPEARILLVGDPAQHQAIEAGAPFEQLIKAGIRSARLDKVLRQRTSLKKPVELLSQKEVLAAVELLNSQGRITEIKDDIERLQAIATDYVNNPKATLIISPANSERVAINKLIHHELQKRGVVNKQNHGVTVLVNRHDMTGPERTFALAYSPGEDIIRYNTTSKLYGVKPGDYAKVLANNHKENTITVRFESGREMTYNPERLSGVSVYREAEREFAVGDRIQFRAPFNPGNVKNSELGTIKQIEKNSMTVRLDKKRDVAIDLTRFRHLDHGYAVTSHSSQGQTVNRVLVNAETTETDALLNQRMAYVAISRARFEARVYTDSIKELGPALNRPKNKEVALNALRQSQAFARLSQLSSASQNNNSPQAEFVSEPARSFTDSQIPISDNGRQLSLKLDPTPRPSKSKTTVGPELQTPVVQDKSFTDRLRELNYQLIVGEKLNATLKEKYAARNLQEAIDNRDFRRYFVMDETTGARRQMSIHQVEQRAMRVAGRVATEQMTKLEGGQRTNMYRWSELRDVEYSQQLLRHAPTIKEILDAHSFEVQNLTTALQNAHRENIRATATALRAEKSINGAGQHLPNALLPNDKLNELQIEAIQKRDVDTFEQLERLRQNIPYELGGADRDSFSFARLKGQSVVAESNVRVAEKRLEDFEKSRHFAKFEIEGQEWSLVSVDRAQRLAEKEIEFHKSAISAYRWRLYSGLQNPWKLRDIGEYRESASLAKENIATSRENIGNLDSVRAEVQRLIQEHRTELTETVQSEKQLAHALNRSVEHETEKRIELKQDLPSPQFNSRELTRLEENSIRLRDPALLRLAQQEMEVHFGETDLGREKLASRAIGRAHAAEFSFQELNGRIQDFSTKREFIPVLFQGIDGQEKTASLHDVHPRNLMEQLSSYFSTRGRFEMNAINSALNGQYDDVLSERRSLELFSSKARDIANSIEGPISLNKNKGINGEQAQIQPSFTSKELTQIENFAAKQIDPGVRAEFQNVVESALSAGRVSDFTQISSNSMQATNVIDPQLSNIAQSHTGDYLDQARKALNEIATNSNAEYGTLNKSIAAAETAADSVELGLLL